MEALENLCVDRMADFENRQTTLDRFDINSDSYSPVQTEISKAKNVISHADDWVNVYSTKNHLVTPLFTACNPILVQTYS